MQTTTPAPPNTSAPPTADSGRSVTSNPQPPAVSVFSPRLFSGPEPRKRSVFESPPPTYTRDELQSKCQHIPEADLRTSYKSILDCFLAPNILHVRVKHVRKEKDFYVHEDFLKDRSKFFKTEVSKLHTAVFRRVDLLDVRPETFAIYVNLLYTSKLATKGPEEWHWLCRLYILAERLQDVKTKNLTIDGMILCLQETLPLFSSTPVAKDRTNIDATSLAWLYEHTPENSAARRLAVDYYVQSGRAEWLLSEKNKYPAEFMFDIAVRLMQKRPSSLFASGSFKTSSLYYHEAVIATDKPAATEQKAGVE
ncbi:uncharacterized protein EKO05_0009844 [Ascochyta rabiei]|uniref:Uncharacterized protein n=1 Tax=Didymella rabiei TaxID=5454 RepID=A0A163GZL7_DIDRA|nr:uncharacterized protein EKO05_0009844 [Ascochyta rabiei]KZM25085.1 hypothetical protein ST47_g3762 [Ascochyta rabiei]UPX19585.1 hypothetical protein EKO05_0009844 [Ascochyta rabiei]